MRLPALLLLVSCLSLPCHAREVAGITLDEDPVLAENTRLKLNGAGIRSKFFFEIYVGALYVTQPVLKSPQQVFSDPGAKRMLMHFLYDEVGKEKLNGGWHEGFENNLDENSFNTLKARLDKFKSYFHTVKKGDVIYLDYLPDKGTKVTINSLEKGAIEGQDFHQALMKVWLGKNLLTGI